jgi:hypothetical protein
MDGQALVPALVPVAIAYAVVILQRYDTATVGNTLDQVAAKHRVDFGKLRTPAAEAAQEVMSQRSFFVALSLATVPAAIRGFSLGGNTLGSLALGELIVVFLIWYFRWRSVAIPEGKNQDRGTEMFVGSLFVVSVGGALTAFSATLGP